MKFLFTTLAIGENYLDDVLGSYILLNKKLEHFNFNITTNIDVKNIEKINFDVFTMNDYTLQNSFNSNLKVLSLKYALDKNYEFLIYHNSNVKFKNDLTEEKLITVFEMMRKNDYDVLLNSKSIIEIEKSKDKDSLYFHRLEEYNLFKYRKWDQSHIIDESFMIFKLNWKFKVFVAKWEQFLWYNIVNNKNSTPSGFESGISMEEAGINIDIMEWKKHIFNCIEY
jgi:hypothetical protein